MAGNVSEFTAGSFQSDVLESSTPVLVDFWAPWCGPCRAIAPLVAAIADDFDGRLKVGKVNVDDNPGIAHQFHITSIPTILIFRDGQVVEQVMGAVPKAKLVAAVEKHV
jgi:thioredoxin 1